jgi:hypothetical protein
MSMIKPALYSLLTAAIVALVAYTYVSRSTTMSAPAPSPAPSPASTAAAVPAGTDVTLAATARPVIRVNASLRREVQPLLNEGTNVDLAAGGFQSREQFVAVAYAAHETSIPFVLLKDRVLRRGMTLAHAIHALSPTMNGALEAARATANARADLGRLGG